MRSAVWQRPVAHKKDGIIKFFKGGEPLGVDIEYNHHTVEGGTSAGHGLPIQRRVNDDVAVIVFPRNHGPKPTAPNLIPAARI